MMNHIRQRVQTISTRLSLVFRYVFGFDRGWRDARPAHLSAGICRIAIFLAVGWVSLIVNDAMLNGDIARYVTNRTGGPYYAFGPLLLFPHAMPGPTFWLLMQYASAIATVMAILGLFTRPAMIVSVISTLFLVVLDASQFMGWSHPYNVIFLAAIPFMFSRAGVHLSLDRWLYKKYGLACFNPHTEKPVFWAVLAAQYSAALFYFGAFWAKAYVSAGGWHYIFSDSMRHIFAITWHGYVEMLTPWYVTWIASHPLLWMGMSFVHLVMQFIAIFVVFATYKPCWRLFEGLIFALSCLCLYIFMSVLDPWWLLLCACFVDWDYFYAQAKARGLLPKPLKIFPAVSSDMTSKAPILTIALLVIFFGTYIGGFVTQKIDELKLYPFSDMNMYAAVYAMKPYNQHLPYVDIFRGDIVIDTPHNAALKINTESRWIDISDMDRNALRGLLPNKSRKTTQKDPVLFRHENGQIRFANIPDTFPLMCRETDLGKLKNGIRDFLQWIGPLPDLPAGSKVILRQQTWAYSAYPETFGTKKIFHSGVRGIYDIQSGNFSGMSPQFDPQTRILTTHAVNTGKVLSIKASFGVTRVAEPRAYIVIKGQWLNPQQFQIDKDFLDRHGDGYANILIHAQTPMGVYDFDGPLIHW